MDLSAGSDVTVVKLLALAIDMIRIKLRRERTVGQGSIRKGHIKIVSIAPVGRAAMVGSVRSCLPKGLQSRIIRC